MRACVAPGPLFSAAEYSVYRAVTDRLKAHVEATFGLGTLFFTAPTFITRCAQVCTLPGIESNRFLAEVGTCR